MAEEAPQQTGSSAQPRLLDLVRDAITRRHYSLRTEERYVHWIRRFIYFSGRRHPRELGAAEVTEFLNHLARERNVAASPAGGDAGHALADGEPALWRGLAVRDQTAIGALMAGCGS